MHYYHRQNCPLSACFNGLCAGRDDVYVCPFLTNNLKFRTLLQVGRKSSGKQFYFNSAVKFEWFKIRAWKRKEKSPSCSKIEQTVLLPETREMILWGFLIASCNTLSVSSTTGTYVMMYVCNFHVRITLC